jgi:hypothetical protein
MARPLREVEEKSRHISVSVMLGTGSGSGECDELDLRFVRGRPCLRTVGDDHNPQLWRVGLKMDLPRRWGCRRGLSVAESADRPGCWVAMTHLAGLFDPEGMGAQGTRPQDAESNYRYSIQRFGLKALIWHAGCICGVYSLAASVRSRGAARSTRSRKTTELRRRIRR